MLLERSCCFAKGKGSYDRSLGGGRLSRRAAMRLGVNQSRASRMYLLRVVHALSTLPCWRDKTVSNYQSADMIHT